MAHAPRPVRGGAGDGVARRVVERDAQIEPRPAGGGRFGFGNPLAQAVGQTVATADDRKPRPLSIRRASSARR